jgi:Flp pilus assembly protein TadD
MMFRLSTVVLVASLAATLAACKSDPKVVAQKALEKGNEHLAQQKVPEAIIEYRRAVQADPRLGEARLKLATAYASTGDGVNALREYVRAADLLPDDHAAQTKAGAFMLFAGQFNDAQALALRMLQRNPKDVEAQVILANSLAGLKDINGAISAFEKAVELDPTRATTYSELGSVQMVTGNKDAAGTAFRKAIEIAPNSASAHLSYSNFLWATGDMAQAEQEMRKALALEPNNPTANRAMAMYYMVTNRADAAEPHLKRVADSTAGPSAKYFLAEYYLRRGKLDEARNTLTPLLKDNDAFVGTSVRLARSEERRSAGHARQAVPVRGQHHQRVDRAADRHRAEPAVGRGPSGARPDLRDPRRQQGSHHRL